MREIDNYKEAPGGVQLPDRRFWQGQEGDRRLHLSTFLVPLAFMVLHHLVLNGASIASLLFFLKANPQYSQDLLADPTGATMTEVLIAGNIVTYASLLGLLVLIPCYLLYLAYQKRKARPLLTCKRLSVGQLLSSISVILGALGLTQVWMVILASLDPASLPGRLFQEYLDKMALYDGRSSDLPLELLVTVILVPIGEELLFRGIIQGQLRRSFSPAISVVVNTLLFAIFHLDLIQGSYVLIAGFALSLAYELTRNIFVPILMHVVFNFVGSGWFSRLTGGGERAEVILVIILYAFILLGALGVYYLYRKQAAEAKAGP